MIEHPSAPSVTRELPAFRSKVDHLRPTYGFEDVSLAPGIETVEPADVELGQSFCGIELAIPVLASAMDAVVDPAFAGALAGLGGLAVLNLEGVQARYDEPAEVLERIATAPDDEVHHVLKRDHGLLPRSADGEGEATWIVADYSDVVLHVFTPEARAFYRLEELWDDVPHEQVEAATA